MKKNDFLQLLRGICIIFVIIIHSLSFSNTNVAYNIVNIVIRTGVNFCTAIFFFISAYLVKPSKVSNVKNYVISCIKRLYIPFIIWSSFYTVLTGNININSFNELVKTIFKIMLGTSSVQLYYIVILLELKMLTPFLIKIIDNKNNFLRILCFSITPLYLIFNFIYNVYSGHAIQFKRFLPFGWFIYYFIGLEMSMYNDSKSLIGNFNFKLNKIWLLLVINIFINILEYKYINYSYVTSQLKLSNMFYVILLIYSLKKIESCIDLTNIFSKITIKFGDLSFGIYFVHILVLKLLNIVLREFSINYFLIVVVRVISTALGSYIIISLLNKVCNKRIKGIIGL